MAAVLQLICWPDPQEDPRVTPGAIVENVYVLHAFTQGRVHRHLTRWVFSKKPSRPLRPGGQAVKYQNENIPIGFLDPKNVGVDPKIRVVGVKLVEILNKIYRV